MSHGNQKTISKKKSVKGIGVHSGAPATLTFLPAEADSGVRFRRMDLDGKPEIPVNLDHVCGTELGTSLGKGEVKVMTVEHVMAALAARGIDNAILELTGPEPPILDGSFKGYLDVLDKAGIVEQDAPRKVLKINEPVTVKLDTGEFYVAAPGDGFRISATIEFEHPGIGRQFGTFFFGEDSFTEEIASARVHLAIPDKRVFLGEGESARASIVVSLRPGKVLSRGSDQTTNKKPGKVAISAPREAVNKMARVAAGR